MNRGDRAEFVVRHPDVDGCERIRRIDLDLDLNLVERDVEIIDELIDLAAHAVDRRFCSSGNARGEACDATAQ